MGVFLSADCPHCRRRFQWSGESASQSACPSCGQAVPASDLATIEEFRQLLARRRRPPGNLTSPGGGVELGDTH